MFEDDKSTLKIITGANLGILLFSVWPLIYYYTELSQWNEVFIYILFLTLVISITFISLRLSKTKHTEVTAFLSLAAFILTYAVVSNYEAQVKNHLAYLAGFFEATTPVEISPPNKTKEHVSKNKNYKVLVPNEWQIKTLQPAIERYFEYSKGHVRTEFRPRCAQTINSPLSDIANSVSFSAEASNNIVERNCQTWGQSGYSCKITITDENKNKRLRWFASDNKKDFTVAFDFILEGNSHTQEKHANFVINSFSLTNNYNFKAACPPTVMKWF